MKKKIKIYVNYEEKRVLNDVDFEEMRDDLNKQLMEDIVEFDDWLMENYSISEVFKMSKKEKIEAQDDYFDWCQEEACRRLLEEDGWTEEEIDVEFY